MCTDLVDEEISIGIMLTGGELAAAVVAEAVIRLVPGLLDEDRSLKNPLRLPEHSPVYPPACIEAWRCRRYFIGEPRRDRVLAAPAGFAAHIENVLIY